MVKKTMEITLRLPTMKQVKKVKKQIREGKLGIISTPDIGRIENLQIGRKKFHKTKQEEIKQQVVPNTWQIVFQLGVVNSSKITLIQTFVQSCVFMSDIRLPQNLNSKFRLKYSQLFSDPPYLVFVCKHNQISNKN